MADIDAGAQSAVNGAPTPAPVAGLAVQRELGALLDVRHGRTSNAAALGFCMAGVALIVGIPLNLKMQSMDQLSASFSLVRVFYLACVFAFIGGLSLGIRALVARSRSYYRYVGGLVYLRKSGVVAIAWTEAQRLEPVYQRRTQSDAGRILGYRLYDRSGGSILIPLALVEGRDRFMDGVIGAVRSRGLQVG